MGEGLCAEANPLPSQMVQERFLRLGTCLRVDLVEGGTDPVRVKLALDGGPSRGDGWEVVQTGLRRFLAVGKREEAAEAWAKAGYVVADRSLLRLRRWSRHMGTFTDPKVRRFRLCLVGNWHAPRPL